MTNTSTVAFEFKRAFYNMAKDLFNDDPRVLVTFGSPSSNTADDMIDLTDVRTTQDFANLSVTNRSREEVLELDVVITSYRAGEQDDDLVPTSRIYDDLLAAIEFSCRKTDTTLGGVVRECFLTKTVSRGASEPSTIAAGRLVACIATFTARARISS